MIGREGGKDLPHGLLREGAAVGKIPCLGIEAALAAVGAAADEQRHAHPRPVGHVVFFNGRKIHKNDPAAVLTKCRV